MASGAKKRKKRFLYFPGFGSGPYPGANRPFLELLRHFGEVYYVSARRRGLVHFGQLHNIEHLVTKQVAYALSFAYDNCPPSDEYETYVIANSLGCVYALEFARLYPVDHLVLISPSSMFKQSLLSLGWGFIQKSVHLLWNDDEEIRRLGKLQAKRCWHFFFRGIFPRILTLWAEIYTARMPVVEPMLNKLIDLRDSGELGIETEITFILPQRDHLFYVHDQTWVLYNWSLAMGQNRFHWMQSKNALGGHDYIFWAKELILRMQEGGILPKEMEHRITKEVEVD